MEKNMNMSGEIDKDTKDKNMDMDMIMDKDTKDMNMNIDIDHNTRGPN
jgi:hypothetical protein